MGDGDVGKSREKVLNSASTYFDLFLSQKQIRDTEERDVCRIEIFQEFSFFLFNFRNSKDEFALKYSTCIVYVGAAKELVKKKFQSNPIWAGHDTAKGGRNNDGGWFTKINYDIMKQGLIRAVEQGTSIRDKALPLGRDAVENIVIHFLGMHQNSSSFNGVSKAMYILITFLTIGRAGEGSWATWRLSDYNSIQKILYTEWNEHKTHQQSAMNFFPDREKAFLDIYFMFALFWISGSDAQCKSNPKYLEKIKEREIQDPENAAMMFPGLVIPNAAALITEALKECKGKVHLIPADDKITAKSLRCGGLQEVYSRSGDKFCGVFRGGWWTSEYEHTFSEYMSGCFELLTRAGLLISGHPKGSFSAATPNLSCIIYTWNNERIKLLNSFIQELFLSSYSDLESNGLGDFVELVFASFLRFFEEFITKFGVQHALIKKTMGIASKYNLSLEMLLQWGSEISK